MTERPEDIVSSEMREQIKQLLDSLSTGESGRPTDHPSPDGTDDLITYREPERAPQRGENAVPDYQPLEMVVSATQHAHNTHDEEDPNDLPLDAPVPEPRMRRSVWHVYGAAFAGNGFHRDDSAREWLRKGAFWLSVLTLLMCLAYTVYALWLLPALTVSRYEQVRNLYTQPYSGTLASHPDGMRRAFYGLYDKNADVRGYLQYHAVGNEDFLDIEYPVMRGNTSYLDHDFFGYANENGTPFLDERCVVDTADATNRVLIVYGNNTIGDGMFSGLNELVGSVYGVRAAPTVTFSTLFEEHTYQVFAVVLTDEDSDAGYGFDGRRTTFADDTDFLTYVEEIRRRSMFTYPVSVSAEDQLLVLSTIASPSVSKMDNARLLVYARKMGEGDMVSTVNIHRNDQVVMPLRWYYNQDLEIHGYYENLGLTLAEDMESTPTTTTTADATATTTTTTTTESTQETTTIAEG